MSIYAGSGSSGEQFTMQAYGAGDSLLGSDTVTVSAGNYQQLDVTSSSGISSVVLTSSGGAASWVYDNLSVDPVPEPSVLAFIGLGAVALIGCRLRKKTVQVKQQ